MKELEAQITLQGMIKSAQIEQEGQNKLKETALKVEGAMITKAVDNATKPAKSEQKKGAR